jgi:hypothetical protein
LNSSYPNYVVAAITLACHPWPDFETSQSDISVIATELLPGFNLNHPDMLEIAVDRLLRLDEAMRFEGNIQLAAIYANAAAVIDSFRNGIGRNNAENDSANMKADLIAFPLGIGTSKSSLTHSVNSNSNDNNVSFWKSPILCLLGAAIFRGSRDIGLAVGGEKTGVSISELAEHLGVNLPEKDFDTYLDRLDKRVLDVLETRTFRLGVPDTLADIAARWSVTRERLRQIELKASDMIHERFAETFRCIGSQSIAPLTRHVFRVDVLYEIATRIARLSRHREILSGFLANIFGPWKRSGRWMYHVTLAEKIETLRRSLSEQADKWGVICGESIARECTGLFLTTMERNQFLQDEFSFGYYLDTWTSKNTMRCQVAAALRKIGRPATKEELAELLGHSIQSIGSAFGNIEGIVRADRYRWGFDEWVDDAYDGIYNEIAQRITDYGGSVPVHILMRELPGKFDVAENSVKAYLTSSAFVVEEGLVRMAGKDEYVPRNPAQCADAIKAGEYWGYRALIYDRHFNGYSFGVNFDVAYANGLRPGDNLLVPVAGTNLVVSLIWRPHNLNRLVDVGRITEVLLHYGFKAGDTIILIPQRDKLDVIHEREFVERDPKTRYQQHGLFDDEEQSAASDMDGEVRDPLLDLLGDDQ